MGSNRLITKDKSKVEVTSLTELFEKQCPIYMSYGMTYDEYWYGELYRARFYRDSYLIKIRQKDEELWMQGMYIYEALCKVSPILHAFSKKGTKPLQYSEKPYLSNVEIHKTSEDKEKEKKNAQLIAILHFERWARETKKKFEKKQGGE
mgnify:CR=1 FL=1